LVGNPKENDVTRKMCSKSRRSSSQKEIDFSKPVVEPIAKSTAKGVQDEFICQLCPAKLTHKERVVKMTSKI